MLTPYGAENKGQTKLMLNCCQCWTAVDALDFWHCRHCGKGRTFVESFGQSCISEGKETREKGEHQRVQSVLDVVISRKHRQLSTPTIWWAQDNGWNVMPGRMEGEENKPRWEGRRGGWNTRPLPHSGIKNRLKVRQAQPNWVWSWVGHFLG